MRVIAEFASGELQENFKFVVIIFHDAPLSLLNGACSRLWLVIALTSMEVEVPRCRFGENGFDVK